MSIGRNLTLIFFPLLFLIIACVKNNDNQSLKNQGLVIPNYIPEPLYKFENNPTSIEGFELGRMLFYDPILSSDSSISCGSCHHQSHAFADQSIDFSIGVNGRKGLRNSPALFNLSWQPYYMWDGGINHIEIMPLAPLTNHLEMNETISNILLKLNRNSRYKSYFNAVFNKDPIDDKMMFLALAQFTAQINSFGSKYDQMRQHKLSFSQDELNGYELFKQHCNTCHKEPLFSDFSFRNNGIDSILKDEGRGMVTQQNNDKGKFKVPSLRNIELTSPYMHDGRFNSLNQVINHYSESIKNSTTVDQSLINNIHFSENEKHQLITFLKTLTDSELTKSIQFSAP